MNKEVWTGNRNSICLFLAVVLCLFISAPTLRFTNKKMKQYQAKKVILPRARDSTTPNIPAFLAFVILPIILPFLFVS